MARSTRITSLRTPKSVTFAAILALLPGLLTLASVLFGDYVIFSVIWVGVGMIYVERWFYAQIGYAAIILVFLPLSAVGPTAAVVAIILLLVYQCIVLPIWAAKRAREYNDLDQSLK